MADLVTEAEAFNHLRFDTTPVTGPDALWLAVWIPAISEAVLGWLKDEFRAYVQMVDSNGPLVDSNDDPVPAIPLVPKASVKAAVLLELESMNRFRDGGGVDNVVPGDAGWGYTLNKASTAILTPLRRPTVR